MDTIRNVLDAIRARANDYFRARYVSDGDVVILGNSANPDGSSNTATSDKIVLSVYNITHETIVSQYLTQKPSAGSFATVSPPLYIDLHLVAMANFAGQNYAAGLAALSQTISFFQQNPIFDHNSTPQLDPAVDKIALEFVSLPPAEIHAVMAMLGTRYLPCVFYKLRVIPFAEQSLRSEIQGAPIPTGIRQP